MEINLKVEISLSPALSAFLQGLTSGTVTKPEVVEEEKAVKEVKAVAAKEKKAEAKAEKPAPAPAPAAKTKPGLTDIRQWAVKSAENKAALKAELANHGVEKLDQLPEDKIETVYQALTEEL